MPRKKSSVPRARPPRTLIIATLLPSEPAALLTHCTAGSAGFKAEAAVLGTPSTLATLDTALVTLGSVLQAAENGTPPESAAVKVAADNVRTLWGQLATYAQGVLRAGPSTAAPPILAAVMMYASRVGTRKPKAALAVTQGPSGTVKLVALAILNALIYDWDWSLDQVVWSCSRTGEANTTVTGLMPGKTYYFRVRAFLRGNTTTDYEQTISFMVK
jgi:hypothetical protein